MTPVVGARAGRSARNETASTAHGAGVGKSIAEGASPGPVWARWRRPIEFLPFGLYLAWFALVLASHIRERTLPGYDGWLYREASATWLAGGDPWSVGGSLAHYAGAPTTVLAYLPTVLIPGDVWRPLSVFVSMAAAVFVLKRIRIPLYWLLYTPLAVAIILGQPGVLVLALLVSRFAAAAPLIKAFAGLPLLWRWREAAIAIALGLATMVLASGLWLEWLRRLPELSARLVTELYGVQPLWLLGLGAAALVVIARRRPQHARWLAIAALWPLPEYHYAIFALPTRLPWLLLAMAIRPGPWPVVVYAAFILVVDQLRIAQVPKPAAPPTVPSDARLMPVLPGKST